MSMSFGTNRTNGLVYDGWRLGLVRHTVESNMNAQIPTILDTIVVLPLSNWSEAARNSYDLFTKILEAFHTSKDTVWPSFGAVNLMEDRLTLCNIYVFIQRLTFYNARLHSKSLEDYTNDLRITREAIGVPVDFDLAKELHDIKMRYHERRHKIQESFSEVLGLEWVGPKIPVIKVSTKIENPSGIECIICGCELGSDDLLTVPCLHAYCYGCLKHWVHAAQKASHTYPCCRTELFPKPEYRPKHIDDARNYEKEINSLRLLMLWRSCIERRCSRCMNRRQEAHKWQRTKLACVSS